MLGLYVSDHPLQGLQGVLSQHAEMSITSVLGEDGPQDGAIITIAGMITSLSRRIAKTSGNAYARAEVEDLGGSMEVMKPKPFSALQRILGLPTPLFLLILAVVLAAVYLQVLPGTPSAGWSWQWYSVLR